MSLNKDTVVTRSESILYSRLQDQIVMMNIDSGEYYDIDPVGASVWEKMEGRQTVSALCDKMANEYSVASETCEKDVLAFLTELSELGAIELD